MKRVISLITVLVLCFALAVPAFATEVDFVPSITAKPAPGIDVSVNEDGDAVIEVKNAAGELVYTTTVDSVIVTAVSEVYNKIEELLISEEAAESLKEAYEALTAVDAKLSEVIPELKDVFEGLGLPFDGVDSLVVTDLFDLSILNDELASFLGQDNHTLDITFNANVPKNNMVFAATYNDGSWQLTENAVNNGDGTVTVTFRHFCPVAILTAPFVEAEAEEPTEAAPDAAAPEAAPEAAAPEQSAEGGFAWWWIIVVVAAVVIVAVIPKKSKAAKK